MPANITLIAYAQSERFLMIDSLPSYRSVRESILRQTDTSIITVRLGTNRQRILYSLLMTEHDEDCRPDWEVGA